MNVPTVKSEYIETEILEVSFVRMVFIACGRKEMVVQKAAIRPIMVILSEFMVMLIRLENAGRQ